MRSIAQESRNFRDKLVRSILAPNKSKINILDYLQGCSVTAADWLRFDTWGVKLHGVSMPFITGQFHLKETASHFEVARSIVLCPHSLFLRQWTQKGSQPLYIRSRTYIKVNRGAITGLPEEKIGKMAEDLILNMCLDQAKRVGENMAELLSHFSRKRESHHQIFL